MLAEDDHVIVHSRYSGIGLPVAWVVIDIVRIQDGVLIETLGRNSGRGDKKKQSKSGNPMFGSSFPSS